jgi:hypothetical protein
MKNNEFGLLSASIREKIDAYGIYIPVVNNAVFTYLQSVLNENDKGLICELENDGVKRWNGNAFEDLASAGGFKPTTPAFITQELGLEIITDRAGLKTYKGFYRKGFFSNGFYLEKNQNKSKFHNAIILEIKDKILSIQNEFGGFISPNVLGNLLDFLKSKNVNLSNLNTLYPDDTLTANTIKDYYKSLIIHLDSTLINEPPPFDYATYNEAWEEFLLYYPDQIGNETIYATYIYLIYLAYVERVGAPDYQYLGDTMPEVPNDRSSNINVIISDIDYVRTLLS